MSQQLVSNHGSLRFNQCRDETSLPQQETQVKEKKTLTDSDESHAVDQNVPLESEDLCVIGALLLVNKYPASQNDPTGII